MATTLRGIVATRIIPTIAAVVALGSAAQAATLSTSFVSVNSDQIIECFVTNLSKKPVTLTVTFFDFAGAAETPIFDSCNGSPLAAGRSCQVQLAPAALGRCTVVADTGKIRAAINVFGPSTFPLVAVVPATK